MSYYYKAEDVRSAAEGHWIGIIAQLESRCEEALRKPGKHVECPIHGRRSGSGHGDGFRVFKDVHLTGGGICNTCGPKHDGFELLMWMKNISFQQCLKDVGDTIGAQKIYRHANRTLPNKSQQQPYADQPQSSGVDNGKRRCKGILTECGIAPFAHKEGNEKSFFVTIRNHLGVSRTFWGVDLPRALEEVNGAPGNEVTLYSVGKKEVVVEQEIKNKQGEVVDSKPITTYRNEWRVVNHSVAEITEPVQVQERNAYAASNRTAIIQTDLTLSESDHHENDEFDGSEPESNVIPMFQDSVPSWVRDSTQRLEQQALRRKTYGVKILERHTKLWEECLPINAGGTSPLRLYFERRGFLSILDTLAFNDNVRFHPALPYFEEDRNGTLKEIGKFPAIVASIQDVDGNLLTLHRIYLSNQGQKAKVSSAKKMMVVPDGIDINGASIQTGNVINGVLGVAEGLETALAAYRATGIPSWSTINAQLMKSFQPPEGVHTVIIWADLDRSHTGELAANILKKRLEERGIFVVVALPQCAIPPRAKSVDWNDVLLNQGRFAFPSKAAIQQYHERNMARVLDNVQYSRALM